MSKAATEDTSASEMRTPKAKNRRSIAAGD
jgi:hypothetical protein